ncbi:hypothetical protein [Desulfohalobium retbaense]|uniref:hypothetical protein n=1 Tax=Desulfohalobium retbaense TaxID=45663 RepID=UPI0012948387|nr:hypothetical protein [Desulfohalobium retbaense]
MRKTARLLQIGIGIEIGIVTGIGIFCRLFIRLSYSGYRLPSSLFRDRQALAWLLPKPTGISRIDPDPDSDLDPAPLKASPYFRPQTRAQSRSPSSIPQSLNFSIPQL